MGIITTPRFVIMQHSESCITSVSFYSDLWHAERNEDPTTRQQVSTKLPFTGGSHVAAMAHPDPLPLLRLCNHLCVRSGLAPSFHFLTALLRLEQSLQPTFVLTVILCHLWYCHHVHTRNLSNEHTVILACLIVYTLTDCVFMHAEI